MVTTPSIPNEPMQTTISEDEMQKQIDEKYMERSSVFQMLDFGFMPMGTKLVGEKIRDMPTNQHQQEDQSQMPPESQGPKVVLSSQVQITFCVDKGSTTPLSLRTKIEQV